MTLCSCAPSSLSAPCSLKAVLFDRDDTLVTTDPGMYREAALWAADHFGLDARVVGSTMQTLWQERGGSWWGLRSHAEEAAYWADYGADLAARLALDAGDAGALLEAYPYERFMKAVPNARAVLTELRGRGLKVGVLSNTLPSIDRTLAAVGLADLVDVALATCLIGVHKPEAGAFEYALKALGVQAGETLFVDDRPENVEAARALGLRAALIDLKGERPAAIHDLAAVLELTA